MREKARQLRSNQTDAEWRLWQRLRAGRFADYKFKRQEPIGPYIADFFCHARRLVVEVDGSQHSESPHDAVRDDWFRKRGFQVVRFWDTEVLVQTEAVEQMILEALKTPLSPPSPAGGGGKVAAEVADRPSRPLPHGARG